MTDCNTCLVRNRAICGALSSEELELLNKKAHHLYLEAGQSLSWEGEDSLLVANVINGVLKLSNLMEDGREQIVGLLYPSDFVGRPYAEKSGQTVTAMTDSHLCVFPRGDFENFASDHPELERKLLDRTFTELDRARDWMMLLGRKTAQEKIASFLLELSERLAENGCSALTALDHFHLPLNRQQMADVLGLTIETVSRQLTMMRNDDIIALPDRRSITILDRHRLNEMSGQVLL